MVDGNIALEKDEVMLHPEIQEMITMKYNKGPDDYDGRRRERAFKEFTYVYLMYDYASTYAELDEKDRHIYSLRSARLPQDYVISKEMKALIEMYKKEQAKTSLSLSLLIKVRESAHKLGGYFDKVDFEEKDEQGKLVYDIRQYMNTVKELGNVLEGLHKLEQQVKSELNADTRLYGGSKKGIRED